MHGGLLVGSILTTTARTSCPRGNALTSKRGNGVTPELTRELIHVPGSSLGKLTPRSRQPAPSRSAPNQVAADRIREAAHSLCDRITPRGLFPLRLPSESLIAGFGEDLSTALASLPRLIGAGGDPDSLGYVLLADALVTA